MATAEGADTERGFEIGKDEAWFANVKQTFDAWFANIKRTYDEYQHESLESIRQNRTLAQKILTDAQQHDNMRQAIANQALQNAVETANMVGKQAVRHGDLSIDRQWNVDEVSDLVAKSGVQADAIASALAGKVSDSLSAKVTEAVARAQKA